jgi:LacI family transcriptional regulator
MATIYEVSELAGVSLATVSRVINNSGKVTAATRKKVEVAMKALSYRPNSIAQSLASNRSNSVGVLVPELHAPFFGLMLSSIEDELRAAGKHVIITAGHSDKDVEKDSIEFLVSRRCDALILHVFAISNAYLLELARGPVPFTLIGRDLPEMADRCFSIDNELGGYLATRALIELGHRDMAYLAGPLWKSDAKDRYDGFQRALAEAGLGHAPELLAEGNYQEASGRQGMQRLLAAGKAFTGLVCGNDEMAVGAIAEARERGMTIPDELSVVGFDNVFFTRYLNPALSTVNYPLDMMGRMAARCVLRDVYGRSDLHIQNRFEPALVRRASVAHCAWAGLTLVKH